MPDLSQFLPLVTLLGRAGEETSEYKAAKAAGWVHLLLFLLGIVGVVLDCSTKAFDGTHAGVWLGAASAILAAVMHTITANNYAAGRLTTKQKASAVLQTVATIASVADRALASIPAAPQPAASAGPAK